MPEIPMNDLRVMDALLKAARKVHPPFPWLEFLDRRHPGTPHKPKPGGK